MSEPAPGSGYESPVSLLNREVSNILSRGQPPEPDERHKWTHPSPVTAATSRPLSCPLYPATPRQETVLEPFINVKKAVSRSPAPAVSPYQLADQSAELRSHLYQAAYQHHSPFRFPFLPVSPVNRYFQSLPPSPLRLPYPFPYPGYPPTYPLGEASPAPREAESGGHKRKHPEDGPQPGQPPHSAGPQPQPSHKSPAECRDLSLKPGPGRAPGTSSRERGRVSPGPGAEQQAPYFRLGSLIQLASGATKPIEDLNTDDFVTSAAACPDIAIDQARVARLEPGPGPGYTVTFCVGEEPEQVVTTTVSPEHPFFVTAGAGAGAGAGWSSCSPHHSLAVYGLRVAQLRPGHVCISLRHVGPRVPSPAHAKVVRFQDSPGPVKKKRVSPGSSSPPVSLSVRLAELSSSSAAELQPLNTPASSQQLATV